MKYGRTDLTKYDLKLLWQKTILDQVNRIMRSFSEGDPETRWERIYMSIMGLDSVLKWYETRDPKFKSDIENFESKIKTVLNELFHLKNEVDGETYRNTDFMRAKFRLDRLMMLLGQFGFYPEIDAGISEETGALEKVEQEPVEVKEDLNEIEREDAQQDVNDET